MSKNTQLASFPNSIYRDSNGNIGIGTAAPNNILTLSQSNSASATSLEIINSSNASTTTKTAQVLFQLTDTSNTFKQAANIVAIPDGVNVLSASLTFGTRSGDANPPTERMRLTSAGNLGIGTTSPTDSSGFGTIIDLNGSTASMYYTRYNGSSTIYAGFGQDSNTTYLLTKSTPLSFYVNNSERMRITSTGHLLVGTSTDLTFYSTWDSGVTRIGRGGILFAYANNDDSFMISQNYYVNSSGNDVKWATSGSANIFMSSGSMYFRTNPSGSAGSTISWNNPLTLTNGGNAGIGTTSPSYRLDVQNTSDFDIRIKKAGLGGTVGLLFETANDFSGTSQAYIKGIGAGNSGLSTLIFGTAGASGDTSATERMRITSAGNVCIGGTLPLSNAALTLFAVNGSTNSVLSIKANNTSGSNPYLYLEAPGVVGGGMFVDRNSSTLRVWQAGDTTGVQLTNNATSWGSYSDERLKDIIEPISDGLSKVNVLRAVIGKYKTDESDKRRVFLIAQDVQQVLPEAVYDDRSEDKILSLQYTDIIPLLVKSIQELSDKNDELETKLKTLENK